MKFVINFPLFIIETNQDCKNFSDQQHYEQNYYNDDQNGYRMDLLLVEISGDKLDASMDLVHLYDYSIVNLVHSKLFKSKEKKRKLNFLWWYNWIREKAGHFGPSLISFYQKKKKERNRTRWKMQIESFRIQFVYTIIITIERKKKFKLSIYLVWQKEKPY